MNAAYRRMEIALALDEDAENVKLTLSFLQRHGLIEICDDDEYQLRERKKQLVAEADCYNVTRLKRAVTI